MKNPKFVVWERVKNCWLQIFSVWMGLNFVVWERVNTSTNSTNILTILEYPAVSPFSIMISISFYSLSHFKLSSWMSIFLSGSVLTLYGTIPSFNPLPDDEILESSKLKQIVDDILKCI